MPPPPIVFTAHLKHVCAALGIQCANELPTPPDLRTNKKIWTGLRISDHQDLAGKLWEGLKFDAESGGTDPNRRKRNGFDCKAALERLGNKEAFLQLAALQYSKLEANDNASLPSNKKIASPAKQSGNSFKSPLPGEFLDKLCKMGVEVVKEVVKQISADARRSPARAFDQVAIGRHKKHALRIDVNAEDTCERLIAQWHWGYFKNITFHGEESLSNPDLDLTNSKSVVALADAIDGTDLLERGIENWCSAIIFFDPTRPANERILASFVGLPSGEVYFARADKAGAFIARSFVGSDEQVEVAKCSSVTSLQEASICFYGQKIKNLTSTNASGLFRALATAEGLENTRLYNLAGMPMMMKLIDHRTKNARCIDLVFEIQGQKPHDFVPGAFIAKKAGAYLTSLSNEEISFSQLEKALFKPSTSTISYVLSSTKELAKDFIDRITSRRQ